MIYKPFFRFEDGLRQSSESGISPTNCKFFSNILNAIKLFFLWINFGKIGHKNEDLFLIGFKCISPVYCTKKRYRDKIKDIQAIKLRMLFYTI